jgi:hypothetical protein
MKLSEKGIEVVESLIKEEFQDAVIDACNNLMCVTTDKELFEVSLEHAEVLAWHLDNDSNHLEIKGECLIDEDNQDEEDAEALYDILNTHRLDAYLGNGPGLDILLPILGFGVINA